MRRKKQWMMQKPVFIDIFLKIFLSVFVVAVTASLFTIMSKLENRHIEMKTALEQAQTETLFLSGIYNNLVLQNIKNPYIPEPLYSEYKNGMEYSISNFGYAAAVVDLDGNNGTPEIIMDNFNLKVFSVYINGKDSESYFPDTCYALYEDDPQLTDFFNRAMENPNMQHWFKAETIYVCDRTKEFVPASVQLINNETGEILATYTRKLEVPRGFVKDEIRNTTAVMEVYSTNYTYDIDGKWYEPISQYGNGIQMRYGKDAAVQLREDIQNSYYNGRVIDDGIFGDRYCAQADDIQLVDKNGETHLYRIIHAMKYNLWEYYRKSIIVTVFCCTVATLAFSMMLAYLIFLRKYTIWQQNAFCRTLTNAVAHDLKTPLMVISGMADNLKESVTDERPLYYAEQVTDTVGYMNRMIEDILDLNRIEGNKPILKKEQVNLNDLFKEVKDSVGPIITDKALIFSIRGDGKCNGDYTLLRQAFGNLVDNAVKYTPNGGEICIEIDKQSVQITNTGVTLPKAFIRKAFDPFTKKDEARSNQKGGGVGLAIAKNIFDAHEMKCRMTSVNETVLIKVSWK